MQVVKYILMALYILNCLAVIVITMIQTKDSNGASGTIVVLLQVTSMRRIKAELMKEN